jgi:hypothetical protein
MKTLITLVLASTILGIVAINTSFLQLPLGQEGIATRVHLRLRTSKFYHRASTHGRHAKLGSKGNTLVSAGLGAEIKDDKAYAG